MNRPITHPTITALLWLLMTFFAQAATAQTDTCLRPEVLIRTTMGDIRVQLYNETPQHRDNFLKLIREHHFYDSLLFHRVIPDFMIQAGDPQSKHAQPGMALGNSSLDYTLPAEIRLPQIFHKRGALAAAREGDARNPEHRSSSTQFYIVYGKPCSERMLDRARENLKQLFGDSLQLTDSMAHVYTTLGGTPYLDGAYTVFGEVVQGMDIVNKIQLAERDANDRPLTDIRILSATIVRDIARPTRKSAPNRKSTPRKPRRR